MTCYTAPFNSKAFNVLRRSAKTVENLTLPYVQPKKYIKDSRD